MIVLHKIKNVIFILMELLLPVIVIWLICFKFTIELFFSEINFFIGTIDTSNSLFSSKLLKIIAFGLFTILVYSHIRKRNENRILFNGGDYYNDYPYFIYWICAKLLNYKICTLKNVPLYLQYKLLLKNLFPVFLTGDNLDEEQNALNYEAENMNSLVRIINKNKNANTVNLILIDTYNIDDNKLPDKLFEEYSIFIRRVAKPNGVRKYNQKFIDQIKKEISKLDTSITTINIYATTNPKHNKSIVQNVFSLGDRSSIKYINVSKQKKVTFEFDVLIRVK